MDNEFMEKRERFIISMSDVPPAPVRVGGHSYKVTK